MRLLLVLACLAACKAPADPLASKLEASTLSASALASTSSLRVYRAITRAVRSDALYAENFWLLELRLANPAKVELDAAIEALVGEQQVSYASTADAKVHYIPISGKPLHNWIELPFSDPGFKLLRASLKITGADGITHTVRWP